MLEAAALGAVGWVSGFTDAFPRESVKLWELLAAGKYAEALPIYRWFTPVLHLDDHPKLVQYIKLAQSMTGVGTESVRMPRCRWWAKSATASRASSRRRSTRVRASDARAAEESMTERRVLVIGAGVVGINCAIALRRQGFAVTVVDEKPPGEGTSFGNAGCIATAEITPISMPGLIWQVPKMLADPLGRWPSAGAICRNWRHGCGNSGARARTPASRRSRRRSRRSWDARGRIGTR